MEDSILSDTGAAHLIIPTGINLAPSPLVASYITTGHINANSDQSNTEMSNAVLEMLNDVNLLVNKNKSPISVVSKADRQMSAMYLQSLEGQGFRDQTVLEELRKLVALSNNHEHGDNERMSPLASPSEGADSSNDHAHGDNEGMSPLRSQTEVSGLPRSQNLLVSCVTQANTSSGTSSCDEIEQVRDVQIVGETVNLINSEDDGLRSSILDVYEHMEEESTQLKNKIPVVLLMGAAKVGCEDLEKRRKNIQILTGAIAITVQLSSDGVDDTSSTYNLFADFRTIDGIVLMNQWLTAYGLPTPWAVIFGYWERFGYGSR